MRERSGRDGMTNLGIEMTLYFSGDMHQHSPPFGYLRGARDVPSTRLEANEVMRVLGPKFFNVGNNLLWN
jgi:hypothetical protein